MGFRLRKVLVAVFFTIAALALAEALLRIFAPIYTAGIPEAYQYDLALGTRLKPGVNLVRTTDHQEEIHTNGLGTVNFQESFRDYAALVFAIGDSYTQGTGLPADACYPFQLDLILNRDERGIYAKRFGVVNLGLSASGAEQAVIALRHYASVIGKPGIVLYLGAENDFSDDLLFRKGNRHKQLVEGSPYWGRLLRPVRWLARTQLGTRARLAGARWRRAESMPAGEGGATGTSVAQLEQPALEKIAQNCREYDAYLVMSWANAPSSSYDWLRAWTKGRGIAFADWVPAVQSVQDGVPAVPLLNPHSGGHKRAWVNRVIAEEFARQIRTRPPQSP